MKECREPTNITSQVVSGILPIGAIKGEFLLRFARDRRRWLRWLFEAKKRYGACLLNYAVTSNHTSSSGRWPGPRGHTRNDAVDRWEDGAGI